MYENIYLAYISLQTLFPIQRLSYQVKIAPNDVGHIFYIPKEAKYMLLKKMR